MVAAVGSSLGGRQERTYRFTVRREGKLTQCTVDVTPPRSTCTHTGAVASRESTTARRTAPALSSRRLSTRERLLTGSVAIHLYLQRASPSWYRISYRYRGHVGYPVCPFLDVTDATDPAASQTLQPEMPWNMCPAHGPTAGVTWRFHLRPVVLGHCCPRCGSGAISQCQWRPRSPPVAACAQEPPRWQS
jgi:hypothetical protein